MSTTPVDPADPRRRRGIVLTLIGIAALMILSLVLGLATGRRARTVAPTPESGQPAPVTLSLAEVAA